MHSCQNLTFYVTPDKTFSTTHGPCQQATWHSILLSRSLGPTLRYAISTLRCIVLPHISTMRICFFTHKKTLLVSQILTWHIKSRLTGMFVGNLMSIMLKYSGCHFRLIVMHHALWSRLGILHVRTSCIAHGPVILDINTPCIYLLPHSFAPVH